MRCGLLLRPRLSLYGSSHPHTSEHTERLHLINVFPITVTRYTEKGRSRSRGVNPKCTGVLSRLKWPLFSSILVLAQCVNGNCPISDLILRWLISGVVLIGSGVTSGVVMCNACIFQMIPQILIIGSILEKKEATFSTTFFLLGVGVTENRCLLTCHD